MLWGKGKVKGNCDVHTHWRQALSPCFVHDSNNKSSGLRKHLSKTALSTMLTPQPSVTLQGAKASLNREPRLACAEASDGISTKHKYVWPVWPTNSSDPNLLSLFVPQYSRLASKFHTQPQAQAQFHCYAASQSAVADFQPDGTQIVQTASPKIAVKPIKHYWELGRTSPGKARSFENAWTATVAVDFARLPGGPRENNLRSSHILSTNS